VGKRYKNIFRGTGLLLAGLALSAAGTMLPSDLKILCYFAGTSAVLMGLIVIGTLTTTAGN
jgi:hypothetical protein